MTHLGNHFFNRDTCTVAKDLLGKKLVFYNKTGIITETEAYVGENDPACHASRGRTSRTEVMYGRAGYSYVYFIYGMHHCFNVVTENSGFPAAVLIRGIITQDKGLIDGPGKLCKYFGIDLTHNIIDITKSSDFYIKQTNTSKPQFSTSPRIGVSRGKERLWRYIMNHNSNLLP